VVLALLLAAASAYARGGGADGSFEKRESSHFILFQDVDIDETGGLRGSRRFEQQVLEDLEGAYDRLDQYLGLRPPRKLEVVIYDPAIFDRQFAALFRFAAAGFYEGIIRVRGEDHFSNALSRVLHHELVHAALHAGDRSAVYPGWFTKAWPSGSKRAPTASAVWTPGSSPPSRALTARGSSSPSKPWGSRASAACLRVPPGWRTCSPTG
jgi:hypothetical protein